jgi:ABC-2 type transport system ATP-binding protein
VINAQPNPPTNDLVFPVESKEPTLSASTNGSNPPRDHFLPSIRLRGVHKNFGPVRAVRGIDLTVHPGEVVAFLGPNGAGKTTIIDMILGLSRPSLGTVEVYGMPPADAVSRGLVTAVMQSGGLLRDLTVAETVRLISTLFADSRPVEEVLRRAGIDDIAGRRVGKCSGGQQQRLRFALALLPEPELLILDEPTTGMDVEGRREFWSAIREDSQRGRTVLFATHYLEEADAYADRIVLLSRGRIVADGTASQVKALAAGRTGHPYRDRGTAPAITAGRGQRRGPRRHHPRARHRLRRRGPLPAQPDLGA